jgi:hypothetical protein
MEEEQKEHVAKELINSTKEWIVGDPQAGPVKVTFLSGFSAVFNGLGIGMLLGILLGLSVSPVVSGVIATISSLLAVLIGLNEKFLDSLKSLRIGSFGLFSVVGILLGLYLRANDPFAPSLLDKMEEYRSIGYSDEEARAMITGFIKADSGKVVRQASVLYSGNIEAQDCDYLSGANSGTETSEIIEAFKAPGGFWADFAEEVDRSIPEADKGQVLLTIRDILCVAPPADFTKFKSSFSSSVSGKNDTGSIEQALLGDQANFGILVNQMQQRFSEEKRLVIYQLLAKLFKS